MSLLEAVHLEKVYRRGGSAVTAVADVSFSLSDGEILGFLGRNGAGKTTTIKMICGLVRPSSGTVSVCGRDPQRDSSALRHLGVVLEGSRNVYWHFTPLENLEYFGALRGLTRAEARRRGTRLLERLHLGAKRDAPVRSLSRGMQQKVAIAAALLHEPEVLLLDEPTIALDVEAALHLKTLIVELAAEGRAILLTSHHLDAVEQLATRIAIVDQGRLVLEETSAELRRRFPGTAYQIHFSGSLDVRQKEALLALPGGEIEIEDSKLIWSGSAQGLYPLLAILDPLPLETITSDRENLTEIFLEVVRAAQP